MIISLGQVKTDDWIQLITLILAAIGIVSWLNEMRFAKHKLLIIPPVLACVFTLSFYLFLILTPNYLTQSATELSSTRTFINTLMWLISSLSVRYLRKSSRRL